MTPSIDRTLHHFFTITDLDLITEFDFLPNCARFPKNICNGCGMPTEDAYSSGHLVLSHLGFANVVLLRPLILNYTLHQFMTPFLIWLFTDFDVLLNIGFQKAFATGVACQQGTLTPPDTWSCPTLGLACVLMSRPISPELVLSSGLWISNTPRYFSFACWGRGGKRYDFCFCMIKHYKKICK